MQTSLRIERCISMSSSAKREEGKENTNKIFGNIKTSKQKQRKVSFSCAPNYVMPSYNIGVRKQHALTHAHRPSCPDCATRPAGARPPIPMTCMVLKSSISLRRQKNIFLKSLLPLRISSDIIAGFAAIDSTSVTTTHSPEFK